jgi:hypothetical protein
MDRYSIYNLGKTPKEKHNGVTAVRVSAENGMLYILISMIRKYVIIMRESNRNIDIPPPGHTPGNLDFDVLVRSNSLHIFVIPVQIHHVLRKIGVQIPHPMYELEATAFHNFGITNFSFVQKLSSIVQSRFLVANQGQS